MATFSAAQNTHRFQINMPEELADACSPSLTPPSGPKQLFEIAGKYVEPHVMGMLSQRPYSGAPVVGVVIHSEDRGYKSHVVVNGFLVTYADVESQRMATEYMDMDKLVALGSQLLVMDGYLAQFLNQQETRPWQEFLPKDKYPPLGVFTSPPPSPKREEAADDASDISASVS